MRRLEAWLFAVTAFAAFTLLCAIPSAAQLSSASVNGTIRDQKGGVIPGATVVLHNVDTNVDHQSISNGTGGYVILDIVPGKYTLTAKATGFNPQRIEPFVLAVDQIATFDFALSVGTATETVNVEATAAQLDVTSANLGTVIETKQVNDLPLDGRNFTALLELTPGVVPIMVGQSNGMAGSGGFGAPVAVGSDYAFPAINGQTNRSDYFLMDGLNNYGTLESTYAVPPIIDAIQEFKIVSHTDNAEYGDVLGGVVNVVTKSGTNQFHGGAWEYVRNSAFDAVSYFHDPAVPVPYFHQNQYGGDIGGPVSIPKLYNGRNRTFFFVAYQGWHYTRPSDTNLLVPTAAELSGDESDNGQFQIYNPFQTAPSGSSFTRPAFAGNQIDSSLIDQRMVAYAKFVFPQAGPFFGTPSAQGVYPANAVDSTPLEQNQNEFNVRLDQTFGQKDSGWFRYSFTNEKVTSSGGLPNLPQTLIIHARDWGGSYVHIFNSSSILQGQFAKTTVLDNDTTRFTASTANIYQTVGFSDSFANNFVGAGGGFLIPSPGIGSLSNGGESISDTPKATDSNEYKVTYTRIIGRHEIKLGGGYIATGFASPLSQISLNFSSTQTDDPQSTNPTGDALSSFLLNVPSGANRRNVNETERPGGLLSGFIQDSWKATSKLTVNYGLRYDYPFIPPYGTSKTIGEQGGIETGDMDFGSGNYVLQKVPPLCSVRGHAPCIPGTGLPDHVIALPFDHIAHNIHTNYGPRLGFAYKIDDKTVAHGAFGLVFDDWAAVTQMAQNIEGSWPDIGQQIAPSTTNYPTTSNPTPTVNAQNPFGSGSSSLFPPATPFTSNQWFYDPHIKNPYSEQWNFGVQRQLGGSLALRVDYVGSGSHRTNVGGLYNTSLTPGPGDTQPRALYPYSIPTFYDRSIGTGSYNALQVQLDKRYSSGFSYQVAYTWSKAFAEDDGWFGVEGQTVQDPYHPKASRGLSGTNIPNVFSANALYDVPVGAGKRFSTGNKVLDYIAGNWQWNNIFTWRDGQAFTATDSLDRANIGGGGQRAQQLADPFRPGPVSANPTCTPLSGSTRTVSQWINPCAFGLPAQYTFGNAYRDNLRAQRFINLDTSLIRSFPFWGERSFQFRAEAFNLFNHPVLAAPNNDVNGGGFGQVSPTGGPNGTGMANSQRQLQLSGKIIF